MWAASLGFCSVDYQVFVSLLLLLFGWFAVCAASFEFCSVGCLFGVLQCGLPVFLLVCFLFCFAVCVASLGFCSVGC